MKDLFNANGDVIPKRPTLTDEIKRAGAIKAVESGLSSIEKDDADSFADDIVKHYYYGIDPYDLSKELERCGCWDVDRGFVNDMDDVDSYISSELREAIRQWGDTYKPVPPFEIGTALKATSFFNSSDRGVIDEIYEYEPGYYCVKMDGTEESDKTRRLIKFEEAELYEAK